MSEIRKPSLFENSELCSPASSTPTLDELSNRLNRRRTRQRMQRVTSAGIVVIALVVGATVQRDIRWSPVPNSVIRAGIATATQLESAGDTNSVKDSHVHLFASVRHSLPLFQVEVETQLYQHVGWIDTEDIIPVDLECVTDDQHAALQAVLSEETEAEVIYL